MTELLSLELARRTESLVWIETALFAVVNVAALFGTLLTLQKPQAPYASQHVRNSTGCKRYSDVYLLYAFYSCNSVPRPVDVW